MIVFPVASSPSFPSASAFQTRTYRVSSIPCASSWTPLKQLFHHGQRLQVPDMLSHVPRQGCCHRFFVGGGKERTNCRQNTLCPVNHGKCTESDIDISDSFSYYFSYYHFVYLHCCPSFNVVSCYGGYKPVSRRVYIALIHKQRSLGCLR